MELSERGPADGAAPVLVLGAARSGTRLLKAMLPSALYVHIVRDGRNAALSWVAMPGGGSAWRWPRGLHGYACQWASEVPTAQRYGARVGPGRYHELRYEDLVAEPEQQLRGVCTFLGLPFDLAMLDYPDHVDQREVPNHPRLREPPAAGLTDWRRQMPAPQLERFEAIAGDTLSALGYERAYPVPGRTARAGAALATSASRARIASWRVFAAAFRHSPAWRLRPL